MCSFRRKCKKLSQGKRDRKKSNAPMRLPQGWRGNGTIILINVNI